MNDGNGLAEALVGLEASGCSRTEAPDQVVITVETTVEWTGCRGCGTRAIAHEQMPVDLRDLACSGRRSGSCGASGGVVASSQRVTPRPGPRPPSISTPRWCWPAGPGWRRAVRSAGCARPVSKVAGEFGGCWWTINDAVIEPGNPLVDDPDRIGRVRQLGVDETSILTANRHHPTVYGAGLVDLEAHVVIDMVEGNAAADLQRWTAKADPGCPSMVGIASGQFGATLVTFSNF